MSTPPPQDTAFFGHPRGLSTLFFTELWERFSYYGMRALLILFMTTPAVTGGLGFSDGKAGIVYGMYTALVYMLGLPGGWIADRFLGQRRAVLYGGVLIMIGHINLAIPSLATFYIGLGFIVLGTGLLKPNISTMVGQLYTEKDIRRDSGFSIYYMGINIGAFLAPIVCGVLLAQNEGFGGWIHSELGLMPHTLWHVGFGAAALGMGLGLVQYVLGGRHLGEAGLHPVPAESPAAARKNKQTLLYVLGGVFGVPALVGALLASGVVEPSADTLGNAFGLLLAATPVVFFTALFAGGHWTAEERRRLIVVVVLFFGYAVFTACFEQAGSSLTLFADRNTSDSLLGIPFPSTAFQSLNSVFIILLAPVFAGLWVWMARKRREPSSTTKFALAMVLVSAGFLVMLPAAAMVGEGGKASPGWLFSLYLLHTLAELCLSPVGLSSMTKLAPARIAGMVMGIWFLGASLGNYVAGRAAGINEKMTMLGFFLMMTLVPLVAAVLLAALVKPIRNMLANGKAADAGLLRAEVDRG